MHVLGFDYPDGLYFMLSHDMWCRPCADGLVEIGVTAFGIHLSGDFYMCRPRPVGTELQQGGTVAVAELSKSVVAIKSPVAGQVRVVNEALESTPELVHRDPYGAGWIVRVAPSGWAEDVQQLAHGAASAAAAEARMRLEAAK